MPRPLRDYTLFLGSIRVGHVAYEDSDFPNLRGTVALDDRILIPTTATEKRLAEFIELDRASMRLVDVSHEHDVSLELAAINRKLEEYNDYFKTDDWRLVDESGVAIPILCPIVRDGGEIVWRWNPDVK